MCFAGFWESSAENTWNGESFKERQQQRATLRFRAERLLPSVCRSDSDWLHPLSVLRTAHTRQGQRLLCHVHLCQLRLCAASALEEPQGPQEAFGLLLQSWSSGQEPPHQMKGKKKLFGRKVCCFCLVVPSASTHCSGSPAWGAALMHVRNPRGLGATASVYRQLNCSQWSWEAAGRRRTCWQSLRSDQTWTLPDAEMLLERSK